MQGPEEEERAEVGKADAKKVEEKKAEVETAEEEERPEDSLTMRACSAEHGRGHPHTAPEL